MPQVGNWINIVDSLGVWLIAFYLLRWEGVKRLLPVALLGVAVIFVGEQILMYLNYISFPMGYFKVFNTPLFHYVWAAASALIVIHFMKKEWSKKLPMLLVFSAVVIGFAYLATSVGNFALLNGFSYLYDFIFNFVWLTGFVWLADKIFGDKIYLDNRI